MSKTAVKSINHETGLASLVEEKLKAYFAHLNDSCSKGSLYDQILKEIERPLLKETLRIARGNKLRAAEILGINRNTLRKKMKEHALD